MRVMPPRPSGRHQGLAAANIPRIGMYSQRKAARHGTVRGGGRRESSRPAATPLAGLFCSHRYPEHR